MTNALASMTQQRTNPSITLRRDLIVFEFRCKEGVEKQLNQKLSGLMTGIRDPIPLANVASLFQNLILEDLLLPKDYSQSKFSRFAGDMPCTSVPHYGTKNSDERKSVANTLSEFLFQTGLIESQVGAPPCTEIFSLIRQSSHYDEYVNRDTKTHVGLVHWDSVSGNILQLASDRKTSVVQGSIFTILNDLSRAGVPVPFGNHIPQEATPSVVAGHTGVLHNGVIHHAIGMYEIEGYLEILSRTLMVRLQCPAFSNDVPSLPSF